MNRKGFFEFDTDELYEDEVKKLVNTVLPNSELLDYYNMLSKREIFINSYIDEEMIFWAKQILDWNKKDKDIPVEERKIIKVFINSDGGCLNSILNFINAIQLSKTKVYTIAMGKAYSAGGLLLMAGHKRYVFSYTTVLIHDGSTGAIGDTGKVIDNLEFTKALESRVKRYILNNTKITEELYEKNYRRDWWLFADEAVELGIADKIIEDIEEII